MRGAKLVEDWYSAATVARNGWTPYGTPTYAPGGGAILDGTTQYFTRPLANEFGTTSTVIHIEFTPSFALDDNAAHYLLDTNGNKIAIYKDAANGFTIRPVNFSFLIANATISPLWNHLGRNLITLYLSSGANLVWFNGSLVATNATAWTPPSLTTLYIGRLNSAAASYFGGTVHRLYIGQHTSTLAEHTAYYNRSMWNWENRATVNLQLRTADYDIANVRTLDSSGNGNHFTLGDGSTPTTYPTQGNGRMTFDGGDYLARAAVAQPTGAFSVCWLLSRSAYTGTMVAGRHTDAVLVDFAWHLQQNIAGAFQFIVGNAATYIQSNAHNDALAHTVICTWDGTTAQIYFDGISDKAATAGVPVQPVGAAQTMYVARAGAGTWLGSIYDYKYLDGVALNNVQALDYHARMMRRIGSEV